MVESRRLWKTLAGTSGVTRERIRQLQNIALAKLRRALRKREDLFDTAQPVAA